LDVPPTTADLNLAGTASAKDLLALLKTLYIRAGRPSYRTMEIRARHAGLALSKSRVGEIINGIRFPDRDAFIAFVRACGVPVEEMPTWAGAWERSAQRGQEKSEGRTAQSPTAIITMRAQALGVIRVLDLVDDINHDLYFAWSQSEELSHLRGNVLFHLDGLSRDRSSFLERAQALHDALAATRTQGRTVNDSLWNALSTYIGGELAVDHSQLPQKDRKEFSKDFDRFVTRLDDIAGDSGRTLARILDHALALASARADDLVWAVNLNDMADGTFSFAPTSDLASRLSDLRSTAQEFARTGLEFNDKRLTSFLIDLATAKLTAHLCLNALNAIPVDVSGVDFSGMTSLKLEVLDGVMWSQETVWPAGFMEQIAAQSKEIHPGVYQIHRSDGPPDALP